MSRAHGAVAAPASRVRTVVGFVRIGAPVVVLAMAPLADGVSEGEREALGYSLAFGWAPLVGLLEAARRRRPAWLFDCLLLALDIVFFFTVLVVVEGSGHFVLVGLAVPVAYAAYAGGRLLGMVGAVLGSSVGLLAFAVDGVEVDALSAALYPFILLAVALLLDAARSAEAVTFASMRRYHDRAEALAAGVAEGIVVTDPRGRLREVNRAARGLFECPSEAVGNSCADVLGLRRGLERLDCSTGCALLALGEHEGVEVWRPLGTGARQTFLAHVAPVVDHRGSTVEVIHSYRDVTRLKEADEAKTLFLATATHELKTPLTVIVGYAELLRRQADLPDAERQQGLRSIQQRAQQLSEIVDRLLMTSRIEAGRIELNLAPVDVGSLLDDRALLMTETAARSVTTRFDATCPPVVADEGALATVIDHLIDNAFKYSPEHSPVELQIHVAARTVVVSVTDHGIGMTTDQVDRCFERFWQAELGDVRRFGGTGIGLYIVKSLVEGMHGRIGVVSTPGAGTVFEIELRRADVRAEPDPAPELDVDGPVTGRTLASP